MRRNPLLPLALACGALLLGAGPALAAGTATPAPVPSVSAAPTAVASPAPSRSGQVGVVPSGAPETGVPPVGKSGDDTAVTGAAVGAVGAVVLRRRTKVRG